MLTQLHRIRTQEGKEAAVRRARELLAAREGFYFGAYTTRPVRDGYADAENTEYSVAWFFDFAKTEAELDECARGRVQQFRHYQYITDRTGEVSFPFDPCLPGDRKSADETHQRVFANMQKQLVDSDFDPEYLEIWNSAQRIETRVRNISWFAPTPEDVEAFRESLPPEDVTTPRERPYVLVSALTPRGSPFSAAKYVWLVWGRFNSADTAFQVRRHLQTRADNRVDWPMYVYPMREPVLLPPRQAAFYAAHDEVVRSPAAYVQKACMHEIHVNRKRFSRVEQVTAAHGGDQGDVEAMAESCAGEVAVPSGD